MSESWVVVSMMGFGPARVVGPFGSEREAVAYRMAHHRKCGEMAFEVELSAPKAPVGAPA